MLKKVLVLVTIISLSVADKFLSQNDEEILRQIVGAMGPNDKLAYDMYRGLAVEIPDDVEVPSLGPVSRIQKRSAYEEDYFENDGSEYEFGARRLDLKQKLYTRPTPKDKAEFVTQAPNTAAGKGLSTMNNLELYLQIYLHLLRRDLSSPEVITSDGWFKKFDRSKDVVFLISGINSTSNEKFFDTVGKAILKKMDCNLILVDWHSAFVTEFFINQHIAQSVGRILSEVLNLIHILQTPVFYKTTLIGLDWGTIVAKVSSEFIGFPIDYILGIEPPNFGRDFSRLYLKQDDALKTELIHVRPFPYSFAHRDFYLRNLGDKSTFELLAQDINAESHKLMFTFCSDFRTYSKKKCAVFPKTSLFTGQIIGFLPVGRYYGKVSK